MSISEKRMPAKRFQDLIVWQKAHKFVLEIYKYSNSFPRKEIYVLTSQLRRAAISIAANIVEGFKKRSPKDKARFLNIAQGSLQESSYYLILAQNLGYGDSTDLQACTEEIGKILHAYYTAVIDAI
jgi:four helix bundle protein